jgi:hypothetical protein
VKPEKDFPTTKERVTPNIFFKKWMPLRRVASEREGKVSGKGSIFAHTKKGKKTVEKSNVEP